MKRVFFFALCAVLAGCATPPEKIGAASVPISAYSNQSCEQMAVERDKLAALLESASKAQREAVTGDAVGVFLIGIPVSSAMGADRETEISVLKGQLLAIEYEKQRKGCP